MNDQLATGVFLLNLGGPEKLDDVEPFLLNLFSDRTIIHLGPFFLQQYIARKIVRRRAPQSRANYKKIGGGSPILKITRQQAQSLEKKLNHNGKFIVQPCMRYWHPFAHEAIRHIQAAGVQHLIALPLYPHYSVATTGSSLTNLKRALKKTGLRIQLSTIRSWPTQPDYINCIVQRINTGMAQFQGEPFHVVYSAHSLPKKIIEKGDPYVNEIRQTITAVEAQTGIKGTLCYQSRSGPVAWLEPSTPDMLKTLAAKGCRNILMVPISFVSDHVETLYEIDILYRQMARDLGMRLESTPGLNNDPLFIEGLKKLVTQQLRQQF